MVRIGPPPKALAGKADRQPANGQMQDKIRTRWHKIARSSKESLRTPLSERSPSKLPNLYCTTNEDCAKSSTCGDSGPKDDSKHENPLRGPLPNDDVENQVRRSKFEDPKLMEPPVATKEAAYKAVNRPKSFGRHSAARQTLRNRASLSTVFATMRATPTPARPKSTTDLRSSRTSLTHQTAPATHHSETSSSLGSKTSANAYMHAQMKSEHGNNVLDPAENECSQVQLRDDLMSDSARIDTDPAYSGNIDIKGDVDIVQTSSLMMGLYDHDAFHHPINHVSGESDYGATHDLTTYHVNDLRRIVGSEVTLSWKNVNDADARELYRFHQASVDTIQAIITTSLKDTFAESSSVPDRRGPHEVTIRQEDFSNQLARKLYSLPSPCELVFRPVGLLQLYLATINYITCGRYSNARTHAVCLASLTTHFDGDRCTEQFAAVALPDTINLCASRSQLREKDQVQFFPLYLALNPFQAQQQDRLQVTFSTDASWLEWRDESASFTGTIPSYEDANAKRSNCIVEEIEKKPTFALEIEVMARVRMESSTNGQSDGPFWEKLVRAKTRFDVFKRTKALVAPFNGEAKSHHLLLPVEHGSSQATPVITGDLSTKARLLETDCHALRRACHFTETSKRHLGLAEQFSQAAIDTLQCWREDLVPRFTLVPDAINSHERRDSQRAKHGPDITGGGDMNFLPEYVRPSYSNNAFPDRTGGEGGDLTSNDQSVRQAYGYRELSALDKVEQPEHTKLCIGTDHQLTPTSSPPEMQDSQTTHTYFHPLVDFSTDIVEKWDIIHRPDTVDNKADAQSSLSNHISMQGQAAPAAGCTVAVPKRSHHQTMRKKKLHRKSKAIKVHRQGLRSKLPGSNPLRISVSNTSDLDGCAGDAATHSAVGKEVTPRAASPSRITKDSGIDEARDDTRLSHEEERQLEEALAASLMLDANKKAEKAKELENWDDIFARSSDQDSDA